MPRKNIRLQGRSWDHLSPSTAQELHDAISDLGPLPEPVGAEEEQRLLHLLHNPSSPETARLHAADTLKTCNLKLVIDFVPIFCGRGVPPSDLINEGAIGLGYAIEKWSACKINLNNGRTYRLSTYAAWWIRKALQDAVRTRGSLFVPNGHTVLEMDGMEDFEPQGTDDTRSSDPQDRVSAVLATFHPVTALILRRRFSTPADSYDAIARDLGLAAAEVRQSESVGLALLKVRIDREGTRP